MSRPASVLALAAFLAVLAGACGGAQKRRGDRLGTDEYLAGIEITGNTAIETDDLIDGLLLHRTEESRRPLDPYQQSVDADRIRAAYQKLGYFGVDVKSGVKRDGLAQTATFAITEGKRAKSILVFDGLPPEVPEPVARALVELKDGAPFDYDLYDDAKQPLLTLIQNAGYAHAQMDAEVLADKTHAQATVRFVIDTGPACTFGAVSIVGVDGQLAEAIRERVAFRTGERYSAQALIDTQREIYLLGRFSNARVEPDRSGAELVPVKIVVVPANRYESKLGGGFGYEPLTYEVRARASLSAAGIPGPLWNAAVDFRPAYTLDHKFEQPEPKIRVLGTLSRQDLGRTYLKGELELGFDYLTLEAFTSYGPHARLAASGPLGYRWLQLRVGWVIEKLAFQNIATAIVKKPDDKTYYGLDRSERLGYFEAALAADLRDDPLSPRKGAYVGVRVVDAARYAGSQYTYWQVTPDVRGYLPLVGPFSKSVIALRARLGMILGDVPVSERYFSGGASSQRGFSERRLAPFAGVDQMAGVAGVPIGGAGAVEAGVELRTGTHKHLGLQLGGVVFLDGADVVDKVGDLHADLDPFHLNWATGFGVRIEVIKSIVVRLDLGYRLNRTGQAEPIPASSTWDRIAFHLGVGQAY